MFRYPGGKSRLLSQLKNNNLLKYIKGDRLVSPFSGASHFEVSQSIQNLWLNDLNKALFCLLDTISQNPTSLISQIEDFEPSLEKFYEFREDILNLVVIPSCEDDCSSIAFKKLVLHQCSYSGLGEMGGPLGGKKQESSYGIGCRWNAKQLIKRIWKSHLRIKDAKITNLSFEKVIKSIEVDDFLFLDPPYIEKASDLYKHSFSMTDHSLLRDLLRDKSNWMLSYDDAEWVYANYSWAKIYKITKNYKMNRKTKKVNELIIVP